MPDPIVIEQPGIPLTTSEDYQTFEVSFTRKRDGQTINVKIMEIFRQLHSADFTNNEITLNNEVCHLNSFCKKIETVTLSVRRIAIAGSGSYVIDAGVYRENKEFNVLPNTIKVIRIIPDSGSAIESVRDSNGGHYVIERNGDVNITVNNDLTVIITFKSATL